MATLSSSKYNGTKSYAAFLMPKIPELIKRLSNSQWDTFLEIINRKHRIENIGALDTVSSLTRPNKKVSEFIDNLTKFLLKRDEKEISFSLEEILKVRSLSQDYDVRSSYDLEGLVLENIKQRIEIYEKEEISGLHHLLKAVYLTKNRKISNTIKPIKWKTSIIHDISKNNIDHFLDFCENIDKLPGPIRKKIIIDAMSIYEKEKIHSSDKGKLLSEYGSAIDRNYGLLAEKIVEWSENIIKNSKTTQDFYNYFRDTHNYFERDIENIAGGTLLSDIHGRLIAYIQALTGKEIKIEKSKSSDLSCSFNGDTFFLPMSIKIGANDEENFGIYKALASYQAGALMFGTYNIDFSKLKKETNKRFENDKTFSSFLDSFDNPIFSRNLFELFEFYRIDSILKRKFPGLVKPITNLKKNLSKENPKSLSEKISNIIYKKEFDGEQKDLEKLLNPELELLRKEETSVEDTIEATVRAYSYLSRKYNISKEELEEKIMEINFDILNEDREQKKVSHLIALPSDETSIGKKFRYNEWDYEKQAYKEDFVQVVEKNYPNIAENNYVLEVLNRDRKIIEELRSLFESLKPEDIEKVKRELSGDIDYDCLIEAIAEMNAGITPSEKIYTRRYKINRSVASMILSENSGSLGKFISLADPDLRLIDILKRSQIYFSEALEFIGDNYALATFSGETEKNVEFYLIKNFDESYDKNVKNKIGSVKPLKQNRDGAGIRHATKLLSRQPEKLRLLFYIMEGVPSDFSYKDEYAIKDTEKAIIESEILGCRPVVITYGSKISKSIRDLSQHCIYKEISDPNKTPLALTDIYRAMTF